MFKRGVAPGRARRARALIEVAPQIIATAREQAAAVTRGLGAALAWPGLLRRVERRFPGCAA